MVNRTEESPWLTKREAAQRLRVTERTISEWVRFEGLPHVKLSPRRGASIRFREDLLDQWMLSRLRGNSASGEEVSTLPTPPEATRHDG